MVGDVPLSRLLRSRRAVPLARASSYKELRTFPAEADQEEVARAFHRYALVSAPVVDADGRLLGVITVDDVVDVIEEEAEDDILKLGGVSEDDTYVPALQTSLKRLPWLGVNLFTALMGVFVITQFEGTIARLVSLAALMPMVAGMGGNAGTQALTVTVRALAAGEITGGHRLARAAQGAGRGCGQRHHLPRRRRGARLRLVPRARARRRVRLRAADQPGRRRRRRRHRAAGARPPGPGPGRVLQRVPDRDHRRGGVLRLPGAGEPVPAVAVRQQ